MAEHAPYDPVKAHEYYERTKKLKGQKRGVGGDANVKGLPPKKPPPGSSKSPPPPAKPEGDPQQVAAARIGRLKEKVAKLESALSAANAALSEKRQAATKAEKKSSDDKTTAEERQSSKEYRDKHKEELKSKRKKESDSSSGGSDSPAPSNSVSDMSVEELESRITQIKSALADAKRQLSSASLKHGQLAHSAITSEPTFNEQFARFRSAERMPSQ